jgi:hypothetical protein
MNEREDAQQKAAWFGIGKQILSFVAGVVIAAFVVGGARQKLRDLAAWRDVTAPRIERMDSKGTLSFEIFEKTYEKTQARQEERLKTLEHDVKEIEKKIDP